MPHYRLYRLDGAGHFDHCDAFAADGDDAAIENCLMLRGGRAAELWSGSRKVKAFERSGATAED